MSDYKFKYPMTNKCKTMMLKKIIYFYYTESESYLTQDDYELMELEIMDAYGEDGDHVELDHDKEVITIASNDAGWYEIDLNNKDLVLKEFLYWVVREVL